LDGLPTRELRRFELVDAEGRYVQMRHTGTIALVGELPPTTSGKKENSGESFSRKKDDMRLLTFFFFFFFFFFPNKDAKVVVISAPEVLEFRLRGDATKSSNYYFWARTSRAWYCLKSPLAEYADWWKEQAELLVVVPAVEIELASKNPRSFERAVQRIAAKTPLNDFVDKFGAFLLKHFAHHQGSEFLAELKRHVDERSKPAGIAWALDVQRARESNRECNKGNEWACQLLGLPLPERSAPVREKGGGGSGKKRQRKDEAVASAASPGGGEAPVAKKSLQGVEDMTLPDAASLPKKPFKPVVCSVPQAHLLDLFSVCEFVSAFGPQVLGHDNPLSPSQLQEWVMSTKVPVDYEIFLRDLMSFVGNEGKDPSVRGFGAPSENELLEEEAANANNQGDEETYGVVPPLGRLRKLVSFLGQMTWGEILRRFLHVYRAELPAELLRESFAALESWNFGSLPPGSKLRITAFLARKCLHSKRLRDVVEESMEAVASAKAQRARAIKVLFVCFFFLCFSWGKKRMQKQSLLRC
jgi:hypothetical protein